MMLSTAYKLKDSLEMLCNVNSDLKEFKMTVEEWDIIFYLFKILRHFKTVSDKICGEKHVALSSAVVTWNLLLDKIESIEEQLDQKDDRSEADICLIKALQEGKGKLIEYYNNLN